MALLVWIGLATSFVGLGLLTLFGLIWAKDTRLHTWCFRIGLALMLVGVAILSVSN